MDSPPESLHHTQSWGQWTHTPSCFLETEVPVQAPTTTWTPSTWVEENNQPHLTCGDSFFLPPPTPRPLSASTPAVPWPECSTSLTLPLQLTRYSCPLLIFLSVQDLTVNMYPCHDPLTLSYASIVVPHGPTTSPANPVIASHDYRVTSHDPVLFPSGPITLSYGPVTPSHGLISQDPDNLQHCSSNQHYDTLASSYDTPIDLPFPTFPSLVHTGSSSSSVEWSPPLKYSASESDVDSG